MLLARRGTRDVLKGLLDVGPGLKPVLLNLVAVARAQSRNVVVASNALHRVEHLVEQSIFEQSLWVVSAAAEILKSLESLARGKGFEVEASREVGRDHGE